MNREVSEAVPVPERPPEASGPIVGALRDRADALTRIVRTAWFTVVVGCLYAWITLAAMTDVELFLPERTLTLPVIGADISTDGFFLFAPALLLAAFVYFHLMLARLWECYGRLLRACEGKREAGSPLAVDEYVSPWFLTVLIPHRDHGVDHIARVFALSLAWGLVPVTILAIAYRFMRAHELPMTVFHCFLLTVSFLVVMVSLKHRADSLRGAGLESRTRIAGVSLLSLSVFLVLVATATALMRTGVLFEPALSILSPHARLFRAELSRKPADWDEYRWREINAEIDRLVAEIDAFDPESEALPGTELALFGTPAEGGNERAPLQHLRNLENERVWRMQTISGAELGLLPTVEYLDADDTDRKGMECSRIGKVKSPRNLRFAYAVEGFLVNANLVCADLEGADLRSAQLQHADMRDAEMHGAVLRHADLRRATLRNATLGYAELAVADMRGADLSGTDMSGARLGRAVLDRYTILLSVTLDGAGLPFLEASGVSMTDVMMRRADLGSAHLEWAHLLGGSLELADLRGASLQCAELHAVDMKGADLRGAFLSGALLDGTVFDAGTRLEGTELVGAAFRNVDLSATAATRALLVDSFGDASVTLPNAVARPSGWAKHELDENDFRTSWSAWQRSRPQRPRCPPEPVDWRSID